MSLKFVEKKFNKWIAQTALPAVQFLYRLFLCVSFRKRRKVNQVIEVFKPRLPLKYLEVKAQIAPEKLKNEIKLKVDAWKVKEIIICHENSYWNHSSWNCLRHSRICRCLINGRPIENMPTSIRSIYHFD